MSSPSSCPQPAAYEIVAGRRRLFDFAELWNYRELLYLLAWRETKVRYKQAALGVGWALLQPLLYMAVFTVFFSRLIGQQTGQVPYWEFAFAGLLPWTMFSTGVSNASMAFLSAPNLVTKIYFPRILLPAASVAVALLDFAIGFGLMIGFVGWRHAITWQLLLVPLIVGCVLGLATAVGSWAAALNVYYRDVRHALPFFIQVLLFVSPVIYPLRVVPPQWQWVLALNPLVGFIEAFRACLFGQSIDWTCFLTAVLVSSGIVIITAIHFQRLQRAMADVI